MSIHSPVAPIGLSPPNPSPIASRKTRVKSTASNTDTSAEESPRESNLSTPRLTQVEWTSQMSKLNAEVQHLEDIISRTLDAKEATMDRKTTQLLNEFMSNRVKIQNEGKKKKIEDDDDDAVKNWVAIETKKIEKQYQTSINLVKDEVTIEFKGKIEELNKQLTSKLSELSELKKIRPGKELMTSIRKTMRMSSVKSIHTGNTNDSESDDSDDDSAVVKRSDSRIGIISRLPSSLALALISSPTANKKSIAIKHNSISESTGVMQSVKRAADTFLGFGSKSSKSPTSNNDLVAIVPQTQNNNSLIIPPRNNTGQQLLPSSTTNKAAEFFPSGLQLPSLSNSIQRMRTWTVDTASTINTNIKTTEHEHGHATKQPSKDRSESADDGIIRRATLLQSAPTALSVKKIPIPSRSRSPSPSVVSSSSATINAVSLSQQTPGVSNNNNDGDDDVLGIPQSAGLSTPESRLSRSSIDFSAHDMRNVNNVHINVHAANVTATKLQQQQVMDIENEIHSLESEKKAHIQATLTALANEAMELQTDLEKKAEVDIRELSQSVRFKSLSAAQQAIEVAKLIGLRDAAIQKIVKKTKRDKKAAVSVIGEDFDPKIDHLKSMKISMATIITDDHTQTTAKQTHNNDTSNDNDNDKMNYVAPSPLIVISKDASQLTGSQPISNQLTGSQLNGSQLNGSQLANTHLESRSSISNSPTSMHSAHREAVEITTTHENKMNSSIGSPSSSTLVSRTVSRDSDQPSNVIVSDRRLFQLHNHHNHQPYSSNEQQQLPQPQSPQLVQMQMLQNVSPTVTVAQAASDISQLHHKYLTPQTNAPSPLVQRSNPAPSNTHTSIRSTYSSIGSTPDSLSTAIQLQSKLVTNGITNGSLHINNVTGGNENSATATATKQLKTSARLKLADFERMQAVQAAELRKYQQLFQETVDESDDYYNYITAPLQQQQRQQQQATSEELKSKPVAMLSSVATLTPQQRKQHLENIERGEMKQQQIEKKRIEDLEALMAQEQQRRQELLKQEVERQKALEQQELDSIMLFAVKLFRVREQACRQIISRALLCWIKRRRLEKQTLYNLSNTAMVVTLQSCMRMWIARKRLAKLRRANQKRQEAIAAKLEAKHRMRCLIFIQSHMRMFLAKLHAKRLAREFIDSIQLHANNIVIHAIRRWVQRRNLRKAKIERNIGRILKIALKRRDACMLQAHKYKLIAHKRATTSRVHANAIVPQGLSTKLANDAHRELLNREQRGSSFSSFASLVADTLTSSFSMQRSPSGSQSFHKSITAMDGQQRVQMLEQLNKVTQQRCSERKQPVAPLIQSTTQAKQLNAVRRATMAMKNTTPRNSANNPQISLSSTSNNSSSTDI